MGKHLRDMKSISRAGGPAVRPGRRAGYETPSHSPCRCAVHGSSTTMASGSCSGPFVVPLVALSKEIQVAISITGKMAAEKWL